MQGAGNGFTVNRRTAMQTVLEIKNLSVSFRIEKQWVKAVEDVSFEVGAGETLGIVGESGCGKSVTSMATLHLLPEKTSRIDCGQVLYRGRDLAPLSNKEMSEIRGKEISMIFQDSMTSLNPVLTIGRQLAEAVSIHHKMPRQQANEKALELLRKVNIPSPEKRMKAGSRTRSLPLRNKPQKTSLLRLSNPSSIQKRQ